MSEAQEARLQAMTQAIGARNRRAAADELGHAARDVWRLRRDAFAGGSLRGVAIGLLTWPFAHMKQK